MKSHIDSGTVGIQKPRIASFYFGKNLVQKYTLADCCTVCFSRSYLPVSKGYRGGEGEVARRQGGYQLYLSACFFFSYISHKNSKKMTTAPTKEIRKSFRCATSRLSLPYFHVWRFGPCGHDPSPSPAGAAEPSQWCTNTDPTDLYLG